MSRKRVKSIINFLENKLMKLLRLFQRSRIGKEKAKRTRLTRKVNQRRRLLMINQSLRSQKYIKSTSTQYQYPIPYKFQTIIQ